jgi:hypothetical protein
MLLIESSTTTLFIPPAEKVNKARVGVMRGGELVAPVIMLKDPPDGKGITRPVVTFST